MTRLASTFATLKQNNKKALIPYITAGDPEPGMTVQLMHTLVAAGADIIELGVPFSDPMADGPVIQLACERALEHHTSLSMVLEMVARFRQKDRATPVVLMGYLNPIEAMGTEQFVARAKAADVDGVLMVDLPPEEADDIVPKFRAAGLDVIFLIAPTTSSQRTASAASHGSGYIYYVSLKGVTGSNKLNVDDVATNVHGIRELSDLPVAVGFGIKDAADAAAVAKIADGVIVGSSLVNIIASNLGSREHINSETALLLKAMRESMDQA